MYATVAAFAHAGEIFHWTTPATRRARASNPRPANTAVGKSRYPDPRTARYPLASRPSKENWKNCSNKKE